MPLVRYELQDEYSLASLELFRTAPRNDPEAILEGVAMVGLVGVVRQLGNLAEFAAEIFHQLHDEIMATAARGHELVLRVQQLEAEIPAVEKAFLSETNQLRFAYSKGAKWHASICVRQNHCSEGDLPQFIRNSYEECRGPPKFSLLDKFDIGGAGACRKRYSDPSIFKTKWASSELKKAEKAREDRKALHMKVKKSDRRNNGKVRSDTSEPRPASRRVRYSSLSSDTRDSYSDISTPCSNVGAKAKLSQSCNQTLVGNSLQGLTSKDMHGVNRQKVWPPLQLQTLRDLLAADDDFEPLRIGAQEIDADTQSGRLMGVKLTSELEHEVEEERVEDISQEEIIENVSQETVEDISQEETVEDISQEEIVEDISQAETVEDDSSEGDQFVDAMTTMESETESESRGKMESISDLIDTLMEGTRDTSATQSASDDDRSERQQDNVSERQLDNVDLLMSTEVSYSISPSYSDHSIDKEERVFIDNQDQAQAQNQFWQPAGDFAKDTSGIRVQTETLPPLPPAQMVTQPQIHPVAPASEQANDLAVRSTREMNIKASTEIVQGSPVHRRLPESAIGSRDQNSERNQENRQESEDAETDCLKHTSPDSPPLSMRRPSELLADNHCLAESILDGNADNGVSPQPPKLSDSSPSSSSMLESPPRNVLAYLGGEAATNSPSTSSLSTASSPKSPIFSALDFPMSPIRTLRLSASSMSGRSPASGMMRPCSPTLELKPLSSPSLKGAPPPPPPLPPLKWKSKQTSHSTHGQLHKPLQAPPTPPPPPPPPRVLSKLVQPVAHMQQGSRSIFRVQRNDDLIKSISMYDRSKLRKVTVEKQSSKPKVMDEREVLLEQIRTKTFSLRRTATERHDAANRPKPDVINVAAILEKANAIRQAFVGSDEEDTNEEWTEVRPPVKFVAAIFPN
ncbi:hypothetical protein O6H91_02G034300 [Diphasiastrum complanatum]|uniref:Uncharacterized protein n=1 Tax=Diphasiastrum complanatum TaxID=34168 RepID=A0ACC2EEN1_DIPCM|nr:hypothetical protein O6H91_02G034300 [Diphasiastrum complanatum]